MLLILAALAQAALTLAALDVRWVVPLDAPPAATPAYDATTAYVPLRGGSAGCRRSRSRPGPLAARDCHHRWRRRSAADSSSWLATVASRPVRGRTGKANGAPRFPGRIVTVTWDNDWLLCSNEAGDLAALARQRRRTGLACVARGCTRPAACARVWIACTSALDGGRLLSIDLATGQAGVGAHAAGPHHRGQGRRRPADCRHDRQRGVQPGPGVRPSALAVARRRRRGGRGRERRAPYLFRRARQHAPRRRRRGAATSAGPPNCPPDRSAGLQVLGRAGSSCRSRPRSASSIRRRESRGPDHRRRRDGRRPASARRRPRHLAAAGGDHARRPHAGFRLALRGAARAGSRRCPDRTVPPSKFEVNETGDRLSLKTQPQDLKTSRPQAQAQASSLQQPQTRPVAHRGPPLDGSPGDGAAGTPRLPPG